jgi:hypothetical protein
MAVNEVYNQRNMRPLLQFTPDEHMENLSQENAVNQKQKRTEVPTYSRKRARRYQQQRQHQKSKSLFRFGYWLDKSSATILRAAHQAKRLKRKASDYLAVDPETGIRDVHYEYVYKHNAFSAELTKPKERAARPQRRTSPRNKPLKYPEPRPLLQAREGSLASNASTPSPSTTKLDARGTRKIYNPYLAQDNANEVPYQDEIDRFGAFVADAADHILWGEAESSAKAAPENLKGGDADLPQKKPRHWKERLEERFDYMLGLHDNGKYYNSWSFEKVKDDNRNKDVNDASSEAQERKVKHQGRKKSWYDKPIWEQDGNMLSLLFGRSPKDKDSDVFEKLLGGTNKSLLNVFTAALKMFLIVASYLARWASVRGTLPQPLVVLSISTAAICAPVRQRFKIVCFTLICIRTVGELLHGYVYGNDDWGGEERDGKTV